MDKWERTWRASCILPLDFRCVIVGASWHAYWAPAHAGFSYFRSFQGRQTTYLKVTAPVYIIHYRELD